MNRRPLRFVALAYAAFVLWLTVGTAPWRTSGKQVEVGNLNPDARTAPVTWTTGYLSEMAVNVQLFIPVGMLAALLIPRRKWPLALLAGFAFTTLIELVQVPEADRISDPRDLVMNTGGAVLGVVLVLVARMVRRSAAVASVTRVGALEAAVTDAAAVRREPPFDELDELFGATQTASASPVDRAA